MKIRYLAVLIALAPLVAHAANEHANHGNHTAATMQSSEGGFVDGIVKKVDKAGGKVTISHGPLINLNMPAMTMVFRVRDVAWIDRMFREMPRYNRIKVAIWWSGIDWDEAGRPGRIYLMDENAATEAAFRRGLKNYLPQN